MDSESSSEIAADAKENLPAPKGLHFCVVGEVGKVSADKIQDMIKRQGGNSSPSWTTKCNCVILPTKLNTAIERKALKAATGKEGVHILRGSSYIRYLEELEAARTAK